MNSSQPPPSQYPPSMGPGARPARPGEQSTQTRLQEVMAIRQQYDVQPSPSALTISYALNNKPRTFTLPYEAMPVGSLQQSICYGSDRRARITGTFLIDIIRGAENVSGTELTQAQAEGFARYGTKRMMYSYSGTGASVLLGIGMWYRGLANMKFPFFKPKDAAKYDNFPNRFIPLIKGTPARYMWQFTRGNVWIALVLVGLSPVFNSLGTTAMTVGLYRDDRTRPVLENLKGSVDRITSNSASRSQGSSNPSSSASRQPPGTAEDASGQYSSGDQDSPYGMQDGGVGYSDAMNSTGDAPASLRPSPMQPTTSEQQRGHRGPRNSLPRPSASDPYSSPAAKQEDDPFAFNEDPMYSATSDPNSPQYDPSAAAAAQKQAQPRRSWASIRNEARRGGPDTSSPASSYANAGQSNSNNASSNSGDSYSYSSADAERQYAKDQAQKEFDEMLERERRLGESGNEGTAGGAWGRRRG